MKIVIAPDSFKGSLSTMGVADAIEKGILSVFPQAETIKIPVADGGEGLLEALHLALGGTIHTIDAVGPLGDPVKADYLMLEDGTAVVEMAQASGLPLIPKEKRDPKKATTYGTGQLIAAALSQNAKKIIIGIGGSATNDGGAGMAQALGAKLLDREGKELSSGGGSLAQLSKIDLSEFDKRAAKTEFIAACDIVNPLCGEKGASAVYGPQKGATAGMVKELDAALENFAAVIKETLGKDVKDQPGAGAAGGLGAGLMAFCGAKLQPGIEIVLDVTGINQSLNGADLVITGEGRVDFQSAFGKVPDGVARRAAGYGVPTAIIAGSIGPGAEELYQRGVACMMGIQHKPMSLEECLTNAASLLEQTASRLMRAVGIGMGFRCKQ